MSGDNIFALPLNENHKSDKSELELMYNLFQPNNKQLIATSISVFKLSLVGSVLFGILTIPIFTKLVNIYTKDNQLLGKMLLMAIFLVAFFLIQKLVLKM